MKQLKQIPNDMGLNIGIKLNKYLGVLGVMPAPEDCEVGDFFLFPECYLGDTPIGCQLYCCEEVESNLAKCPFCGEEARLVIDNENNTSDMFAVECATCFVNTMWFKTKEEAYEAWNSRV